MWKKMVLLFLVFVTVSCTNDEPPQTEIVEWYNSCDSNGWSCYGDIVVYQSGQMAVVTTVEHTGYASLEALTVKAMYAGGNLGRFKKIIKRDEDSEEYRDTLMSLMYF